MALSSMVFLVACSGGKELPDYDPSRFADPVASPAVDRTVAETRTEARASAPVVDAAVAAPVAVDGGDSVPPGREIAPGVFTRDVVRRGYALVLGSAPTDGMLASWIYAIDHFGLPRLTFLHRLVGQPDFTARLAGLSDAQAVVEITQRFLHRAPTQAEIDHACFSLKLGAISRTAYADRVLASAEFALATNPEHPYFF